VDQSKKEKDGQRKGVVAYRVKAKSLRRRGRTDEVLEGTGLGKSGGKGKASISDHQSGRERELHINDQGALVCVIPQKRESENEKKTKEKVIENWLGREEGAKVLRRRSEKGANECDNRN